MGTTKVYWGFIGILYLLGLAGNEVIYSIGIIFRCFLLKDRNGTSHL